jgi:His-Xaa-Ser system radical SAM maturase HxsC
MTPLALSGKAKAIEVGPGARNHQVLRLVDPADPHPLGPNDAVLIKADKLVPRSWAALAVFVGMPPEPKQGSASITLGEEFDYLAPGDLIGVRFDTARVRTLYRRGSRHNAFLVTERCNHYCLMCSQPPKDVNDGWLLDEIAEAIPLVDPATSYIGFTGGEPLLEWRRITGLLALARDRLPNTTLHVLTNGRGFANAEIANAWGAIAHPDLCAGIPIYSSVDSVHDYVVQAPGAFDETVLGILRLKDRCQKVEVRVVLHAVTAPRIVETARWLARNLPFVDHVALMGLENTGFAIANHGMLWIDPIDYLADLALAVDILDAARISVSIYNLPFCVLGRSVWPFARQSISDWKNAYLPQCDSCAAKASCAGFFSTGRPKQSRAIEPLTPLDFGAFGEATPHAWTK